jgi:hypothetical protein
MKKCEGIKGRAITKTGDISENGFMKRRHFLGNEHQISKD